MTNPTSPTELVREALALLGASESELVATGPAAQAPASTVAVELPPSVGLAARRGELERLGLVELPSRGGRWVGYDREAGRWVELVSAPGGAGHGRAAAHRTRGFGVALMGPDGAGKSTVAAALIDGFYLPARSIYMGLYQEGSRRRRSPIPGLGLLSAVGRQQARWLRGLGHRVRGRLVLFDRYTYDALLPASAPLSRARRLRRAVLARACPGPDLVVILDAPAEVLLARAGEHDLDVLERHRKGLLDLAESLPRAVVVDATREPEAVARDVTAAIWRDFVRRRG